MIMNLSFLEKFIFIKLRVKFKVRDFKKTLTESEIRLLQTARE